VPSLRLLVVGRIPVRALAAGAAAAARELSAEHEHRRRETRIGVVAAAPALAPLGDGRAGRVVGRCLHGLFVLAIPVLAFVLLNVDALLPAAWRPYVRVVCGGLLVLGGLPLATRRGRSLVALEVVRSPRRRRRWSLRMVDLLLNVGAALLVGAGVFELARAIPSLV
jgi:hypothetical protein